MSIMAVAVTTFQTSTRVMGADR